MNSCKPCPSKQGMIFGLDPEAFDFMNNIDYCHDPNFDNLYCPWENRSCPFHLRMKKTALRCHQQNRPIPYRLNPIFLESKKDVL